MARAGGSSAHLPMKRETAYGQAATGNDLRMPSPAAISAASRGRQLRSRGRVGRRGPVELHARGRHAQGAGVLRPRRRQAELDRPT